MIAVTASTSKVGDTLTALVDPEDAEVTYQWLADGEDILGEDDATLFVDEDLIGSKISVEVTDEDGNTAVSDETARVTADKSEDVKIVDVMGLQSDGTAIIGDRLRVSYGVTFGTPTAVTWYRDGAVVNTASVGDGVGAMLNLDITAGHGAGTYKATVVSDGITYETNEILVTTKEEQAEILDFTLEDDYTDGTDITYNATDRTAVATVTLSKNYVGQIAIYRKSDSKYSGAVDTLNTAITNVNNWVTSASRDDNATPAAGNSILTNDQATNYLVENIVSGAGLGHINADGTVTYKFVVDAGLTRGSEYVVTFDQQSIVGDTPGTGEANVFEEAIVAPYVNAPAKVAITKVSNGNRPEITFYDENGDVLKWMGKAGTAAGVNKVARAATNTLASIGASAANIYSNTVKANDPAASTVTALTGIATTDPIGSGVWIGSANATDVAYWFAKVDVNAGIYGEKAMSFVSEVSDVAQDAATMINLTQNKTTATTADVSFSNLRCDGTVYIVRGAEYGTAGTDYLTTAPDIYAGYNAVGNELVTGSAKVEKGASSVSVTDALKRYTGKTTTTGTTVTTSGDTYIAVFIPDDENNYGRIYTIDGIANSNDSLNSASSTDSQGLTVTQKASSIKYAKNAPVLTSTATTLVFTDAGLIAYDQFGDRMVTPVTTPAAGNCVAIDKTVTNMERAAATYTVATGTGQVTVTLTNDGTAVTVDNKDGFTATILGTAIEITNKSGAALAFNGNNAGWDVKVGSTTAIAYSAAASTEYASLADLDGQGDGATGDVTVNNTASGTTATVTINGTAGTVAHVLTNTGTSNMTAALTAARVVTVTSGTNAGNGTLVVTVTGSSYKRTFTYTATAVAGGAVTLTQVSDVISAL